MHLFSSKIIIQSPDALKAKFNEQKEEGSLEYSVSLFGDLLYNK